MGVRYEKVLVPVDLAAAPAARDAASGRIVPLQKVPAMPFDRSSAESVVLALVDVEPGQELKLEPATETPPAAIGVKQDGPAITITNGGIALRLPADATLDQPFPGPIMAIRVGNGEWFGESTIVDVPFRGRVWTEIESVGPCCVQWRTTYRWANDGGLVFRARWAAGSDTVQITEEIIEDCEGAIEWFPFGAAPAKSYVWGGGERKGPMEPLAYKPTAGAVRGPGRRRLHYLSHLGYWNQWNLCWVGFSAGDDRFVGIFSGWGSQWERRGYVRPEVMEDDSRGHMVRFPLKHGRRHYGLLISSRAASGVEAKDARCLLNRRKVQHSDLALAKVLSWQLDPPLEDRKPHLVRQEDVDTFRGRLALEPRIAEAFECFLQKKQASYAGQLAVAFWKNDREKMKACVAEIASAMAKASAEIADGGYDRLIIFDGRIIKRLAYDLDVLWALGVIDEREYRAIRRSFLAVGGYMFSDPDYCRMADFWPHTEAQEGIATALKDDMGDCPVPSNFASEFFSTTGVIAELFDKHPLHLQWRRWAMEQTDRFLETFYEPDGTYHESVNYHTHEFSERMLFMFPLWWKGVRDYFAEDRVKGSFRHFLEIQMPPLSDSIPKLPDPAAMGYGSVHTLYADWDLPRRATLPADGNSGGNGLEQEHRGELSFGAYIYKDTDPAFAAQLMHAWRLAGKVIPLHTHPVLTVLTIDPSIGRNTPAPSRPESVHRMSFGIVSKASMTDGSPVWCLFRAGRATHHMDFDQGNLHLAAWDSVLLGEHGYHTHDQQGNHFGGAGTHLHSTIVYSEDKHMASGYTGLERAPEPALVHIGKDFDWCVHRIVNTNLRGMNNLPYFVILPVLTTRHVRHYLFVKPDYFLVWDVFEEAHEPSVFWLHPRLPVVEEGRGIYRAGKAGSPHLLVKFLLPQAPDVIENEQSGPLWSFGVRNGAGKPYMALLVPQMADRKIEAGLAADGRTVTVSGTGLKDVIHLPEAGSIAKLPRIERKG